MRRKVHDFKVWTDEDKELDNVVFTMLGRSSLRKIKRRMAMALKIAESDIEFCENSQESEGPDIDGITTDVYEVYIKGKLRATVWIEDEWWYK